MLVSSGCVFVSLDPDWRTLTMFLLWFHALSPRLLYCNFPKWFMRTVVLSDILSHGQTVVLRGEAETKKWYHWEDSGGSDSCVKRNSEGKCSGCENASSCGEHRLKNFLCALSLSDYFLFLIVSHLQPLGSLWLVVLEAVLSLKHIMLLYWNILQLSCDQRE